MTTRAAAALSVDGVKGTTTRGYARHVRKDSRRGPLVVDLALCAALLAVVVPVTLSSDEAGAGTALDTVFAPAVVLPILLRRRHPFAAAAALAAGCVISGIPTFDQFRLGAAIPAGMLVLYPLARQCERRRALAGLALVLAGMIFIGLTDAVLDEEGGLGGMIAFSWPLCIGVWAGGRLVRAGDRVAEDLAERSRMLERQREQTAALAVEIERTHLASDLDVAARDRVREVIDLATSAGASVSNGGDGAGPAFARIETIARESLNEMRGLLGVLRSDERGSHAPRPTLARLETLIAEARRGGHVVDLDVEGDRRTLPGGLELAAYRVLQHALVAVRGSDDEPAAIQLRYMPDALEVQVEGHPAEGRAAEVALMAARERVTAHGGSFSEDSASGGRRVVSAHLPTAAAAHA